MKRAFALLFAIFWISNFNFANGEAPSKGRKIDRVVSSLDSYYREVRTLCAEFTQLFTLRVAKRVERARGKLYYLRPGKIRFLYLSPEKKDFIFNGDKKILWMYFPEDEEVRIKKNLPLSNFGVALQFLWGSGKLRDSFRISLLKRADFGKKGDVKLMLIPKKPQPLFKKLFFSLDPRNYSVRETIYIDPTGNKNHFIFSKLKINKNCPLSEEDFLFKIPKGTEVIFVK